MVRKKHADAWSLLNDQFSPVVELWVQRETLSQKIRRKTDINIWSPHECT